MFNAAFNLDYNMYLYIIRFTYYIRKFFKLAFHNMTKIILSPLPHSR